MSQDPQITQWKAECEGKISEIREILQKTAEFLQSSYENYLKGAIPPPEFLPVLVNVSIPSKNEIIRNIHISPTDTAWEIKQLIVLRMEKKGDPIVGFEKSNILLLVNDTDGTKIPITDDTTPIVGHYHPDPGSTLVLQGHLKCKSDAPKQCFKQSFIKGANMAVDYYTCNTCNTNWICKSCADTCHKGHVIVDYLTQHVPSWACCYCVKIGKCSLYKKE